HVPIAVAEIVERACMMMSPTADAKGVELTLFTDPDIPSQVYGDALRLRQILLNLLNNAIKFSTRSDGGGQVSLRAQLVETTQKEATIEFVVADNGIGMDESTLARLFTAFAQGDTSITRRFGGTGLGLTISKDLAVLMNGDLRAGSELGK